MFGAKVYPTRWRGLVMNLEKLEWDSMLTCTSGRILVMNLLKLDRGLDFKLYVTGHGRGDGHLSNWVGSWC